MSMSFADVPTPSGCTQKLIFNDTKKWMCAEQERAAAAEGFKHCSGCKLSFTLRFYQAIKTQPDGLFPLCRGCVYEDKRHRSSKQRCTLDDKQYKVDVRCLGKRGFAIRALNFYSRCVLYHTSLTAVSVGS